MVGIVELRHEDMRSRQTSVLPTSLARKSEEDERREFKSGSSRYGGRQDGELGEHRSRSIAVTLV